MLKNMEAFENKVVVTHRQPFSKFFIVEIGKVESLHKLHACPCFIRMDLAGVNNRFSSFSCKETLINIAMKKLNNLIMLGLLIFAVGCSGGDNNEGVMNPPDEDNNDPVPGSVTYQDDIRIIVQNNCTSCHSNPPTQQAPMSLTTYDEVRNAVNNRRLLNRINSSTAPMPPTGLLPQATRQLFEDWVDLGFPE